MPPIKEKIVHLNKLIVLFNFKTIKLKHSSHIIAKAIIVKSQLSVIMINKLKNFIENIIKN